MRFSLLRLLCFFSPNLSLFACLISNCGLSLLLFVLPSISNREGMEFIGRLAYDMTFFVWVGILLFNVITGLIVDTFSRLREEDAKRIDVLANECYICG